MPVQRRRIRETGNSKRPLGPLAEWILQDARQPDHVLYYTGYCTTSSMELAFRFTSQYDAKALAAHLTTHAPALGVFDVVVVPSR